MAKYRMDGGNEGEMEAVVGEIIFREGGSKGSKEGGRNRGNISVFDLAKRKLRRREVNTRSVL